MMDGFMYTVHIICYRFKIKQINSDNYRITDLQKSDDPHGEIEWIKAVLDDMQSFWYNNNRFYPTPWEVMKQVRKT